jgi:hypothetical protein
MPSANERNATEAPRLSKPAKLLTKLLSMLRKLPPQPNANWRRTHAKQVRVGNKRKETIVRRRVKTAEFGRLGVQVQRMFSGGAFIDRGAHRFHQIVLHSARQDLRLLRGAEIL